jgi:hypothetical protein
MQRMRREVSSETDAQKALREMSVPLRLSGYLFTRLTRILAQSQGLFFGLPMILPGSFERMLA